MYTTFPLVDDLLSEMGIPSAEREEMIKKLLDVIRAETLILLGEHSSVLRKEIKELGNSRNMTDSALADLLKKNCTPEEISEAKKRAASEQIALFLKAISSSAQEN